MTLDAAARSRPTLETIAELAGVSTATASKVINGRSDVADSTRERVLQISKELNYRSPVQRRIVPENLTIELVLDSVTSAYCTEILNGVLKYAAELDVDVVVSSIGADMPSRTSPEQHAQRMIDYGRSGMVVVTSAFKESQLRAFQRRSLPVVVIDPMNPPGSKIVSVGATNWAGGKAATQHLVDLGHQRIAYIGGVEKSECNQARLHGYMSTLLTEGIDVNQDYIVHGQFKPEHGTVTARKLFALECPPTAIFAASDAIAVGVLGEARRQNLDVPRDLSLVGFDDTYLAEQAIPKLTSVSQPLQEMGAAALRSLLQQVSGKALDSRRVELATRLNVRESTGAAPDSNGEDADTPASAPGTRGSPD